MPPIKMPVNPTRARTARRCSKSNGRPEQGMSAFGLFYLRELKSYSRISWSFCSFVIFLRIGLLM